MTSIEFSKIPISYSIVSTRYSINGQFSIGKKQAMVANTVMTDSRARNLIRAIGIDHIN